MSSPANMTLPPAGVTNPVTVLKKVVLPDPFGPMSPRSSPVRISTSNPSSARTPPKRTDSPAATSSGAVTADLRGTRAGHDAG